MPTRVSAIVVMTVLGEIQILMAVREKDATIGELNTRLFRVSTRKISIAHAIEDVRVGAEDRLRRRRFRKLH